MLDEEHMLLLSPTELNKEFTAAAESAHMYSTYCREIQNTCTHQITRGGIHPHDPKIRTSSLLGNVPVKFADTESGVCWICGEDCGWYCPDSPNHICEYRRDDRGIFNLDDCIYCHQPYLLPSP